MSGGPKRHEVLRGTRHIDPDRIVSESARSLDALASMITSWHEEMENASPAAYREALVGLRENLATVSRFAALVEHQAEEKQAALCAGCGSRFYPSRSDAKYCGGACRMRAHRQRGSVA